jgi:hypothetical protein
MKGDASMKRNIDRLREEQSKNEALTRRNAALTAECERLVAMVGSYRERLKAADGKANEAIDGVTEIRRTVDALMIFTVLTCGTNGSLQIPRFDVRETLEKWELLAEKDAGGDMLLKISPREAADGTDHD